MNVTHLEKRSAMALCFPRPLRESSFAVTRKDCVAQDRRLNGPLSISASLSVSLQGKELKLQSYN